jgi:DNA-binding helix-hairpin-helix protein with protein kinase domain
VNAPSRLWSTSGQPIEVGRRLGEGGEGTVYIGDDTSVVKIYKVAPEKDRQEKLRLLVDVGNDQLRRIAAWPTAVVRDGRGVPAGFVMPRVDNRIPFNQITSPAVRKRLAPNRHWDFLAHVCRNVAAAMQLIHDTGVVIGDVNDLNILVSVESGRITFIDVDSFQITHGGRSFPSGVGVPMYLPPELQGASLVGILRTVEHDRFALAVLIFQALMMGRHPYVGIGSIGTRELPDMIRQLPFAYGDRARAMGIGIPPGALPLSVLTPELAELFTTSFDRRARPEARRWVAALDTFKSSLSRCGENAGHMLVAGRGACPWCELERSGIVMFYASASDVDAGLGTSQVLAKSLRKWLDSISVPSSDPPIAPERIAATPTIAPPVRIEHHVQFALGWVVLIGLALLAIRFGYVWVLIFGGPTYGGWLLRNGPQSRKKKARAELQERVKFLEREWSLALDAWRNVPATSALRARIDETRAALILTSDPKEEWRRRLAILESRKRDLQLASHLATFPITTDVRSLNRSTVAALASYGIKTAADVHKLQNIKVPGVGDTRANRLIAWRRQIERNFVSDPTRPIPADLLRAEESRLMSEVQVAQRKLPVLRSTIEAQLQGIVAERTAKQHLLERVARELSVARANLESVS